MCQVVLAGVSNQLWSPVYWCARRNPVETMSGEKPVEASQKLDQERGGRGG